MAITSYVDMRNAVEEGRTAKDIKTLIAPPSALVAGRWYDTMLWDSNKNEGFGNPYPGGSRAAAQLVAGMGGDVYSGGAVSPLQKILHQASWQGIAAAAGPNTLYLVDLLLAYPDINLNTTDLQALANIVALPRYVDGVGVRAFLVVTNGEVGPQPANVQISYTDSDGVPGRTLPIAPTLTVGNIFSGIACSGVAANNSGPFLPLDAACPRGMRSIQSIQLSASPAAPCCGALVLCRPLAPLRLVITKYSYEQDFFREQAAMVPILDGTCLGGLFWAGAATTASTAFKLALDYLWG